MSLSKEAGCPSLRGRDVPLQGGRMSLSEEAGCPSLRGTEHKNDDGTPKYYYELQNDYSEKYIAPRIIKGEKL